MLLRDHPLMSYRGIVNWPPTWVWLYGPKEEHPKGELGILKSVLLSTVDQANRCFLVIRYQDSSYLGCLLFDDHAFCSQIVNILRSHCDYPRSEDHTSNSSHVAISYAVFCLQKKKPREQDEMISQKNATIRSQLSINRKH